MAPDNNEMYRSKILSVGKYLPTSIIENAEFEKYLETSDDWIQSRTGIRRRHIIAVNETTADMGAHALRNALERANIKPYELDGIIVATTTPAQVMPSTAILIARALEIQNAFAFDIQAVCSGFIYALHVANSLIEGGGAENIAIIGVDAMSKIIDWQDRSTCVLFGDGAGALILGRAEQTLDLVKNSGNKSALTASSGYIDSMISSDPSLSDILEVPGGIGGLSDDDKIRMSGRAVFKYAVTEMPRIVRELAAGIRLLPEDIDCIIPHQANSRIIEAVADELKIDRKKVIDTIASHANTSAATIPLAMAEALELGTIKLGDKRLVVMVAVGAGMTAGGALFAL